MDIMGLIKKNARPRRRSARGGRGSGQGFTAGKRAGRSSGERTARPARRAVEWSGYPTADPHTYRRGPTRPRSGIGIAGACRVQNGRVNRDPRAGLTPPQARLGWRAIDNNNQGDRGWAAATIDLRVRPAERAAPVPTDNANKHGNQE